MEGDADGGGSDKLAMKIKADQIILEKALDTMWGTLHRAGVDPDGAYLSMLYEAAVMSVTLFDDPEERFLSDCRVAYEIAKKKRPKLKPPG